MASSVYVEPRLVTSLDDCLFYHTMDIPGYGTMRGQWDLRAGLEEYLGKFNFTGNRVLDVGTASGLLSFYTERKGADVVSFDLSDKYEWDIVPFAANFDFAEVKARRQEMIRRLNNSYWFCHRVFESKARAVYGSVYDIPTEIGEVDVAIYGSILLHLRDPFLALQNGAKLARRSIIVTDVAPERRTKLNAPRFMPNHRDTRNSDTWWELSPQLICEYLAILGFPSSTVTWHRQLYKEQRKLLFTVVASRSR